MKQAVFCGFHRREISRKQGIFKRNSNKSVLTGNPLPSKSFISLLRYYLMCPVID